MNLSDILSNKSRSVRIQSRHILVLSGLNLKGTPDSNLMKEINEVQIAVGFLPVPELLIINQQELQGTGNRNYPLNLDSFA